MAHSCEIAQNLMKCKFWRIAKVVFTFEISPFHAFVLQSQCYTIGNVDESYEFLRLQQAMRSIGFSGEVQQRFVQLLFIFINIPMPPMIYF